MRTRMKTMISAKKNKNKVLLGLSGGVDSTAAALLLKEKGFEVTGYYFDISGNNKEGRTEAANIASQLGIELICEDVSEEFETIVVSNFCSEYAAGRTPNPCIICNPYIKFKKLMEKADEIGAYYIATGHYCNIGFAKEEGKYYIERAANESKDQSYMLYRLGQDVLSRLIFPLGEFEDKARIRELAKGKNLSNAEKKDSQEICFVDPSVSYAEFIESKGFRFSPGSFVDKEGRVLGEHKGIVNYTVGQRKGLGIALGRPAFISKIDHEKNQVVIGDNEDLFTIKVLCKDYIFPGENREKYHKSEVLAKVRYQARPAEATLNIEEDTITAVFKEPQRAPAPGQSIVFYDGNRVIGGGFIA